MSASLRKFVPRSPRYTLRPNDNSYMRFAQKGEMGQSHITQFVDISMTGLAFITERDTAPFLFEMIKIEIPVDGGEQIAWWAKVVRVEEYLPEKWYLRRNGSMDESKVLVAIQYHDLPLGHLEKIKKTLDHKFVELERAKVAERFKTLAHIWSHYTWQVLLYGALIAMTFGILYYFAQPDANYDASRGAPWGQRYKGWLGSGSGDIDVPVRSRSSSDSSQSSDSNRNYDSSRNSNSNQGSSETGVIERRGSAPETE